MDMQIKSLILDIEGTTTDILFVKNVLFKIAFDECNQFLTSNFELKEIQEIVRDLCAQSKEDKSEILANDERNVYIQNITKYVQDLIKADRKLKPLKQLQGCLLIFR
jgi:enolase-phosphatase E1